MISVICVDSGLWSASVRVVFVNYRKEANVDNLQLVLQLGPSGIGLILGIAVLVCIAYAVYRNTLK